MDSFSKYLPIVIFNDTVIDTSADLSHAPQLGTTLNPTNKPEWIEPVGAIYPETARSSGIECDVWMNVLINPEGRVLKAIIFKSDDARFNYNSLHAIVQWRFSPAMYGNSAGYYWMQMPLKFRLHE